MNAINVTLPITDLHGPIPPLMKLNAMGELEDEKELKITYRIVEASDETLVYIENDAIRLNRSRLSSLAQSGSGKFSVMQIISVNFAIIVCLTYSDKPGGQNPKKCFAEINHSIFLP